MLDNLLSEEYIMLHRGYNLTNHDAKEYIAKFYDGKEYS